MQYSWNQQSMKWMVRTLPMVIGTGTLCYCLFKVMYLCAQCIRRATQLKLHYNWELIFIVLGIGALVLYFTVSVAIGLSTCVASYGIGL